MATKVFDAVQTGFRQLKEKGCWSLSFHTQELTRDQAMDLSDFTGQYCKVVISDTNIDKDVIELVENVPLSEKEKWTPSQKLRFAIRDLQIKEGLHDQDGEEYYREWMTKLISHINKLSNK